MRLVCGSCLVLATAGAMEDQSLALAGMSFESELECPYELPDFEWIRCNLYNDLTALGWEPPRNATQAGLGVRGALRCGTGQELFRNILAVSSEMEVYDPSFLDEVFRAFAIRYPDGTIVEERVTDPEYPWGHRFRADPERSEPKNVSGQNRSAGP